jgi:hypothetical protein
MQTIDGVASYHALSYSELFQSPQSNAYYVYTVSSYQYDFENFFDPWVGALIQKLNLADIKGMLSPDFLSTLKYAYQSSDYVPSNVSTGNVHVTTTLEDQTFDVRMPGGPYAGYHWELVYHIPIAIAVHLSNNQRFAEAQKWFHLVFDPTDPQQNYWKSYAFSASGQIPSLDQLLTLLSAPDAQLSPQDLKTKARVLAGYNAILANPFDPFVVARTRSSSFQWYAVMKYLDNLIAWGDSLFLQDTIETLNEATLCYVRAANLLGPRPQSMPRPGTASVQNFRQLKQAGLDRMSNALVELESQFPFNTVSGAGPNGADQSGALFGIGRSLYFCIPNNQTLLAYWDTVSDRLFKIRNSENIQGVYQQLPLFDPPLDPGMLVKAAAAGIDIGAIVSGLNQPLGPLRSLPMIQKALELAQEVKAMGAALLAAMEKGDAETLAQLRQGHEVELQTLMENVRFLEWRHAQESTNALLASRASVMERYAYYLRLFNLQVDASVPATLTADRRELTEANWNETYNALVAVYEQAISTQTWGQLQLAQGSSPSDQSGASGAGQLYLNVNEDADLNKHSLDAQDERGRASSSDREAAYLSLIPNPEVNAQFWGIGVSIGIPGGEIFSARGRAASDEFNLDAADDESQAVRASKTGSFQRRADEWRLQINLAAEELMTLGTQILASLIAEQVAYHEYTTAQAQIQQAQAVQSFLQNKFTSEALYLWMQSQLSGLYYQYYRFACDTARRAELTVKQELMRPELDQNQYIQFNYWDTGHQGLLSGEALCLDLKRLEMAYHDSNKRELELTRHVSLALLNPVALVALKITGATTITIPEWMFDLDGPGLYMRRIKMVSLSIPGVVGPYTSLNCTLTLQRSSVRILPTLSNNTYARDATTQDPRFVDYYASTDIVVTSSGDDDSGMFEPNLNDQRFLPFEGAGAISAWSLSLPGPLRAFDYMTISDVILHLRYTARAGGSALAAQASKELGAMLDTAGQSSQAAMVCLRYDFPAEWAAFANGAANFAATLTRDRFPYMTQGAAKLTIDALTLYAGNGATIVQASPSVDLGALSSGLSGAAGAASLSLPADPVVMQRSQALQVFVVLRYHFGAS